MYLIAIHCISLWICKLCEGKRVSLGKKYIYAHTHTHYAIIVDALTDKGGVLGDAYTCFLRKKIHVYRIVSRGGCVFLGKCMRYPGGCVFLASRIRGMRDKGDAFSCYTGIVVKWGPRPLSKCARNANRYRLSSALIELCPTRVLRITLEVLFMIYI